MSCQHEWKVGDKFRRLQPHLTWPYEWPRDKEGIVCSVVTNGVVTADGMAHDPKFIEFVASASFDDRIKELECKLEDLKREKAEAERPKIERGQFWSGKSGTYEVLDFDPDFGASSAVVFKYVNSTTGKKRTDNWPIESVYQDLKLVSAPCKCSN